MGLFSKIMKFDEKKQGTKKGLLEFLKPTFFLTAVKSACREPEFLLLK